MFELYLDSADVNQITRFHQCLPLNGVTTNPTILAKSGIGLNQLLKELTEVIGPKARFHVQVVSSTVEGMVEEARRLQDLPYDIVVKVPADEKGLAAIKKIKSDRTKVLATAIYSVQQGFLAALCGADYLAPYVNRIDGFGANGPKVVSGLQVLLDRQLLPSTLLPASFKNTQQVLDVLKAGVKAITLPVEIAEQMLVHPAVRPAVEQFESDWQNVFGEKLPFES